VARLSERLKSLIKIDDRTLVVLDEASMIDLPTLHAILRHMPEGPRLLLTGDAAQLPPIGFGLVYHALVSDAQITANLTVIHRQAPESGIPTVSAAVRERRMPLFAECQGVADGVSFVPCESGLLGDVVERIVLQLGGYSNGVLVVSSKKKSPGGVDALNARLHEQFRPSGAPAHDIKGFNAQYYTIGDPVMWLRNDYSRGFFNGQIGKGFGAREKEITILCSAIVAQHHAGAGALFAAGQGPFAAGKVTDDPAAQHCRSAARLNLRRPRTEQVKRLRRG